MIRFKHKCWLDGLRKYFEATQVRRLNVFCNERTLIYKFGKKLAIYSRYTGIL